MPFGNPEHPPTSSAQLVLQVNKLATALLKLEIRVNALAADNLRMKNEQTYSRTEARRTQQAIAIIQRRTATPY